MSTLYGANHIASVDEIAKSDALMELYLMDDLSRLSDKKLREFAESVEAQVLVERKVLQKEIISKETVRSRDMNRRIKLTAYHLAKEAKSPNWNKLVKYQSLKKQAVAKIMQQYGAKAERIAKIGQKEYIKMSKKLADNAESK